MITSSNITFPKYLCCYKIFIQINFHYINLFSYVILHSRYDILQMAPICYSNKLIGKFHNYEVYNHRHSWDSLCFQVFKLLLLLYLE